MRRAAVTLATAQWRGAIHNPSEWAPATPESSRRDTGGHARLDFQSVLTGPAASRWTLGVLAGRFGPTDGTIQAAHSR